MSLANLYWREPILLLLVFLPLLIIALNSWWQRRQLTLFAEARLIPWLTITETSKRKRLPLLSLLLGWFFLCIAVAGPRSIKELPPAYQSESSILVVILDLSASMNARDMRPDRRSAAQRLLKQWSSQKPSSLAVGLVLFAGHAFELIPATMDMAVITHFTDSLSDIRLPTAGNDLSAAIQLAKKHLLTTQNHRRLLIFTDGDMELSEQQRVSPLFSREWARLNIQTAIIGFGGTIPVNVPDRLNGLIEYQNRPVLSRHEAGWLQQLSKNPAIKYHHYRQATRQQLDDILVITPLSLPPDVQQQVIWRQWFQFPLLLSVLFLLLSVLLQRREFHLVR